MSKKVDYQNYVNERIDKAVSDALNEIHSYCPNVGCLKCKYKDNCVSTYHNRMKAMFLKGALFGLCVKIPYDQYVSQLQNLTNHG